MRNFWWFISVFVVLVHLATTSSAKISINNLPKACLPEAGRMSPDRTQECKCPPVSYCTETVTYNGATYKKLPDHIQDVCCPVVNAAPPPALAPVAAIPSGPVSYTVNPALNECDVHYIKSERSQCRDRTFTGSRVARYCTEYGTTNPAQSTAIANLNSCLATNCKSIRQGILDRSASPKRPGGFRDRIVIYELITQDQLRSYTACRNQCFQSNGLSSLMTAGERQLATWINRELYNQKTDKQIINSGTTEYSIDSFYETFFPNTSDIFGQRLGTIITRDHPLLNDFSAKLYSTFFFSTINQTVFNEYFNNTYDPARVGYNKQFSPIVNPTDDHISNPPADLLANRQDAMKRFYFRKIWDKNFIDVSDALRDHGRTFNPATPDPAISCLTVDDFNTCITTYLNNGTCKSCLSPDTTILMADGSNKRITDIKSGDLIKGHYGKDATVDEVIIKEWDELYLYNINNGALVLTADHPVLTKKGWRAVNFLSQKEGQRNDIKYGLRDVATLEVGDIMIADGKEIEIKSIIPREVTEDKVTYNLRLKAPHKSFYANGILVKSNQ